MSLTSFFFGILAVCFSFIPIYWCSYLAVGIALLGYAFGLGGICKKINRLRGASWFGVIVSSLAVTLALLMFFSF